MAQLGANADGEVLEPGRVPDCYLGLLLDSDDTEATGVQVVAPPRFSTGRFPQPDGTVLYELVTGHPDRQSRERSSLGGVAVAVVVRSIPVSPVRCGTWVARPAKLDAVRTLRRRHELGRRVRSLKPRPSTCRPEASVLYAMRRHAGAWRTKVNALIAFYLPNAPLRANAAKGVTGYDQATLIWSGPGRP
jgi:hypothetical protein